ncbi:hypothetical protein LTR95_002011 [Oleoguttula sp. CCFEE 5521]
MPHYEALLVVNGDIATMLTPLIMSSRSSGRAKYNESGTTPKDKLDAVFEGLLRYWLIVHNKRQEDPEQISRLQRPTSTDSAPLTTLTLPNHLAAVDKTMIAALKKLDTQAAGAADDGGPLVTFAVGGLEPSSIELCVGASAMRLRALLNFKKVQYKTIWVEYPDIAPLRQAVGVPPNPRRTLSWPFSLPAIRIRDGQMLMGFSSNRKASRATTPNAQPTPGLAFLASGI